MNFFDMVRKKIKNKTYRQLVEENQEIVDDALLKALIQGEEINREEVLMIPSVSGAVSLICDSFAMIPFKLYKKTIKDGKKQTTQIEDNR